MRRIVLNKTKKNNLFNNQIRLNPEMWIDSQVLELTDTVSNKKCVNRTNVSLLSDQNHLYIRFVCFYNKLRAKLTKRDDPVWTEEAVEIFLQPPGLKNYYYEIDLNPLNTVADLFVINNGKSGNNRVFHNMDQWNCKDLETRTYVSEEEDNKYWLAEFKIPYRSIFFKENLAKKQIWRGNFYRIDHSGNKPEYQAWNPTEKINFHLIERFGEIHIGSEI